MKKFLISVMAVAGLAGCTYDYYKGGVRYTQDGDDCIYYADEYGRNYSSDIRGLDDSKRIVYRHTRCEDLFARDNGGRVPAASRKVLSAAAVAAPEAAPVVEKSCGCDATPVAEKTCCCNKSQRRVYTVVVR